VVGRVAPFDVVINPNVVAMVGHYRTGTHWLCVLMELYFGHPVAPRTYFYSERPFLAHCVHDGANLMGPRHQVIYLYRDPVDTVFSQSHIGNITRRIDPTWLRSRARAYACHLARWLTPGYVPHLVVIRYECMRADFHRICLLFNQEVDDNRLDQVFAQATKTVVASGPSAKLAHNWIARRDPEYVQLRVRFRERYASLIWDAVLDGQGWLQSYFDHLPEEK